MTLDGYSCSDKTAIHSIRERIYKLDFTKMKNFSAKDNHQENQKMSHRLGENTCTRHT